MDLFLGLELGSPGARAVLVDATGALHADVFAPVPAAAVWRGGNGEHEQDPLGWWAAARDALDRVMAAARASGHAPESVRALAIASPAGALALVDASGMPVGRALMPDDPRGADQAGELNRAGEELIAKLGIRFNASHGLAKLAWTLARAPERFERAARIVHAADFIAGRLTGRYDATDWTHALRTGFDPVEGCWPAFLGHVLQIPREKLPRVTRPGEPVGPADAEGAREAGLAAATTVFTGLTEDCASQLAAGAFTPGTACAALGPQLVLKAVTRELVRDPRGRVPSHRHPADGLWLPRGVSQSGRAVLEREFGRDALPLLEERVAAKLPTRGLVYPLAGRGERFPLLRTDLETWWIQPVEDRTERYGAFLEGAACVERLGWDVFRGLGIAAEGPVRTTGDGTLSESWQAIRAAVLGRPVEIVAQGSAASGMAILAAAQASGRPLDETAAAMVRVRRRVEPRPEWVSVYEERFRNFEAALAKGRG